MSLSELDPTIDIGITRRDFFKFIKNACMSEIDRELEIYTITADNYDFFLKWCGDFITRGIKKLDEEEGR